jgi:hypothetical protein
MALPKPLRQFYRTFHTNLPHLTKPQALTLALWSFAIIHTGSCGLTTAATYAALLRRQSPKHPSPTPARVLQRRCPQSWRPTPQTGHHPLLRGAAALDCPPVDISAPVPCACFRRHDPQATLHGAEYQRAVSPPPHPYGVEGSSCQPAWQLASPLGGIVGGVARRGSEGLDSAGVRGSGAVCQAVACAACADGPASLLAHPRAGLSPTSGAGDLSSVGVSGVGGRHAGVRSGGLFHGQSVGLHSVGTLGHEPIGGVADGGGLAACGGVGGGMRGGRGSRVGLQT